MSLPYIVHRFETMTTRRYIEGETPWCQGDGATGGSGSSAAGRSRMLRPRLVGATLPVSGAAACARAAVGRLGL